MANKYKEYKGLNLAKIGEEINEYWKNNQIFEKSIESKSLIDFSYIKIA